MLWEKIRPYRLLIGPSLILAILITWLWPHLPTEDALHYFDFSDRRSLWGIQNAGDVLSNLAFLWAGVVGLRRSLSMTDLASKTYRMPAFTLSASILGLAFASAFFHLNPDRSHVFWDRLLIALCLCQIIGIVITDRIHSRLGWASGLSLAISSSAVLFLWHLGRLDLRPYIVLQFGGIAAIALIAKLFPATGQAQVRLPDSTLFASLWLYAFAKGCELADSRVFELTHWVSGHTLKHLFSAIALFKILSQLTQPGLPQTQEALPCSAPPSL